MATKTTGAEWKRYYQDPAAWPEGWFHEDEEVTINGVFDENADLTAVPDDAVIVVKGGIIYEGDYANEGNSVEGHFKKWRKAQTTMILMVEVQKDKADDLRAAISAAGGKVVL